MKLTSILLSTVFTTMLAISGCGGTGTGLNASVNPSVPKVVAPASTASLKINLKVTKKADKLSVKADTIDDIVDSVTFTITGDSIIGSIEKTVYKNEFLSSGLAVVQIDDLLPGNVSISIVAKDANNNTLATAEQSNIAMVPGELSTAWLEVNLNTGSSAFAFPLTYPTPSATVPATVEPAT